MKFKEFFWDFDGTLFDTYPRVNRAIQKALKDVGVEISIEEIAPLTKVNIRHALEALSGPLAEDAMARYRVHAEEEGYDTMQPYAGARELLESVCARGGHNYLYTVRDLTAVDAVRHFGLDVYFTDYLTREDGFPRKPAPDALLHLMDKHGLSPADCVMIGDRDIDLDSGVNAGMAGALFDPGHYYDGYETPYRFTSLFDMMCALVWEDKTENLRVSDMLALQRELQALHPNWGAVNDPEKGFKWLLWLVGEVGEVVDVVKKNEPAHLMQPGLARERLVEELTDVAMYFHDVLNIYGITPEEFSRAYYGKMQRNLRRDYHAEHKERYGE